MYGTITLDQVDNPNGLEVIYHIVVSDECGFVDTVYVADYPNRKIYDEMFEFIKHMTNIDYEIFEEHTFIGNEENFKEEINFLIKDGDKGKGFKVHAGYKGDTKYNILDIHVMMFNKWGYQVIVNEKAIYGK